MSRSRRALLRKRLAQRKAGQRLYLFLKSTGDVPAPPEYFDCVRLGGVRAPSPEEIDAAIRESDAAWHEAQAKRPKAPKEPKPLGNPRRTIAARETIRAQKPAVVSTRLARCPKCKTRAEVPAEGAAQCPTCSTGI